MGRIPLAIVLLNCMAWNALAEDLHYEITIDGVRSGTLTRSVSRLENGQTIHETKASMVYKFLFLSFKYQFRGTETWENGSLISASGDCDDNGTRHRVSWKSSGGGGTLTRNNRTTTLDFPPWPTSGATPPPAEGKILTLDPDTGLLRTTALTKAGSDNVRVDGVDSVAAVWKTDLPGDAKYWFAASGILLRQSWQEQGRKVVIQLREITRD